MKKILFLLLFISISVNAQTADSLFVTANNQYKEAKYQAALETYRTIEAENKSASALYFNLGNCYYKLNKVGPTIYNYEKALQLDPLNKDAANNLIFAKRLTLDRIEELPKSIFQKFNQNYLQKLSYNQWAFATVILGFLASFLFLMFYFSENSSKKRGYFVTSILGFLLFFASIFTTYNQFSVSKNTVYAIVFSEKTEVKNGPTPTSEEVFTLHEGAKVAVLDSVDNWKKIKLADGKIGWLISNEIKIL